MKLYRLNEKELSFRKIVSLYSRIWNKPNKEVDRPLFNHTQPLHEAIINLIKNFLFDEQQEIEKEIAKNNEKIQEVTGLPQKASQAVTRFAELVKEREALQSEMALFDDKETDLEQKKQNKKLLNDSLKGILHEIEAQINKSIFEFSKRIETSNDKPPQITITPTQYTYGVQDNTGTGKAYTDLILFDLAILSLTDLPLLIHDSFLLNHIDDQTKQSFIKIYNLFPHKQIFISLDRYLGGDNKAVDDILRKATRYVLSDDRLLFGKDWRN